MTGAPGVVIAGGSQAGFSVASTLRSAGYVGPVTLLAGEPHLPYQRPPLSKKFLTDSGAQVHLVPESFFAGQQIDVCLGEQALAIDLTSRSVTTSTGRRVTYEHLVLATGARNRKLPVPGSDLPGVHSLRSLDDAVKLRSALAAAHNVVVVGGGFIGLELARAALAAGAQVTVVELADRLLARAVSPELEPHLRQRHEHAGVRILTETRVLAIEGADGAQQVVTDRGELSADLVIYGIGIAPRDELAQEAGLAVDDGVIVDAQLRSVTDPQVSAAGDCTRYPHPHAAGLIRLESVQNATESGGLVGRRLAGAPSLPAGVPWFWSNQGDIKLQIAGLRAPTDEVQLLPPDAAGRAAAYAFRDGRLVAVETLNWPAEHLAARRLMDQRVPVSPGDLADTNLAGLARSRRAKAAAP